MGTASPRRRAPVQRDRTAPHRPATAARRRASPSPPDQPALVCPRCSPRLQRGRRRSDRLPATASSGAIVAGPQFAERAQRRKPQRVGAGCGRAPRRSVDRRRRRLAGRAGTRGRRLPRRRRRLAPRRRRQAMSRAGASARGSPIASSARKAAARARRAGARAGERHEPFDGAGSNHREPRHGGLTRRRRCLRSRSAMSAAVCLEEDALMDTQAIALRCSMLVLSC